MSYAHRSLSQWGLGRIARLLVVHALVVGVYVAVLAPAAAQGGRDPAPDSRVAALEIDFLMGMVPHHRGAIMMAEMARAKATRPELRELAATIIASQQAEIGLMSNLLRDWYGLQPPEGHMMSDEMMRKMDMPMLHGLMPDMMAGMRRLEAASGPAFDIAFMQEMSKHHAMAVMMASPVLMAGHHQALKSLAGDIVVEQGEEIKQMQHWLDAWYGVKQVGSPQ